MTKEEEILYLKNLLFELARPGYTRATDVLAVIARKIEDLGYSRRQEELLKKVEAS